MATTGPINGTLMAMYLGGTKVAMLLANNFTVTVPTRSVASKDDATWDVKAANRATSSGGGRALFNFSGTYGPSNVFAAIIARVPVTFRQSTGVSGDKYYETSGILTEFNADFPDNDNSEFSFSFDGTGAMTETTITP